MTSKSVVQNITALCEFSTKYTIATYTVLEHTFGRSQLDSIVRLAAHLIYNPYCSLTEPPVTVSFYPDIAYVATEIMYNQRRGNHQKYLTPSSQNTKKSVAFLKQYIKSLIEIETSHGASITGPSTLYGAYGRDVIPVDGDNDEVSIGLLATQNTGQAAADPNARVIIPRSQLMTHITSCHNDKDRAFKRLLERVGTVIAQTQLPEPIVTAAGGWEHPQYITEPLSTEIISHIQTLGVTLDPMWTIQKDWLTGTLYENYKIADSHAFETIHIVPQAIGGNPPIGGE